MTTKKATSFRLALDTVAWLERNKQPMVTQLEQDLQLLEGLFRLQAEAKELDTTWGLAQGIEFVAKLMRHPGE